jgi:CRP/FNR family cyclic AMP-dependent transcriptional regulator
MLRRERKWRGRMIEKFRGESNRRKLLDELRRQVIVEGDDILAEKLCGVSELLEYKPGDRIIEQGADDDDLYLIIAGRVSVNVHGHTIDSMKAGDLFGEMSLIDPRERRSASIFASEQTVLAKITEPTFTELADEFSILWRRIARCEADRVRARNVLIRQRNLLPVLFIGSASESRDVVRAIQNDLRHDKDFRVRAWTAGGVFGPSKSPIETLEREVASADFAALILTPDDVVAFRNQISNTPRDNTIFELGYFMGVLGRDWTFMILPKGPNVKTPSDLLGLIAMEYLDGPQETLAERIGPVCNDIRDAVQRLGAR